MKKKTIKDPLAQAARLLNENAPEGESLAYINSAEAKMLKDAGGAGEPVNSSGVPSYFLNKLFGGGKAPPSLGKFDVGGICKGICRCDDRHRYARADAKESSEI